MLKDTVIKFYDKSYDLNCAETILYAANEEYGLKLNDKTFKSVAAFGGGMGIEGICGALTGGLAVLGIIFVKDRAHESDKIKELSQEFINRFNEKLGTYNCKELKERYRNDEIRCTRMLEEAADLLDEIIKIEMK